MSRACFQITCLHCKKVCYFKKKQIFKRQYREGPVDLIFKKKKKHAKTYNMVTTVIRYRWLPTLRTCTNFHSSLICIKCQSFQSFMKLLFFLHMYMYRIFKKGFCSTCPVFEYLVSEYGNLILYSSFGFQNSKSCGFQNSKSCVCRLQKKNE